MSLSKNPILGGNRCRCSAFNPKKASKIIAGNARTAGICGRTGGRTTPVLSTCFFFVCLCHASVQWVYRDKCPTRGHTEPHGARFRPRAYVGGPPGVRRPYSALQQELLGYVVGISLPQFSTPYHTPYRRAQRGYFCVFLSILCRPLEKQKTL